MYTMIDRLTEALDPGHMAACDGTQCGRCSALTEQAEQLADLASAGLRGVDLSGMVEAFAGLRHEAVQVVLGGQVAA